MMRQEPFKMIDIKNLQAKNIELKRQSDRRMKSGTVIHKQRQYLDSGVKEIMIGRLEKLENLSIHTVTLKKQQIRLVNFSQ